MGPIRSYLSYMDAIKWRFIWFDQFENKTVSFVDIENMGLQVRKIIEGISYGVWIANGGDPIFQHRDQQSGKSAYSADRIFDELLKKKIFCVPQPENFEYLGRSKNGHIQWRLESANKIIQGLRFYRDLYIKSHLFGHELHPIKRDHFFHNENGLAEAAKWVKESIFSLQEIMWNHSINVGYRMLFVDFGDRNKFYPKCIVCKRPVEDITR